MNKVLKSFLGTLLFLCSCASGSRMMTADSFYDVPIGTTKQELVGQAGSPFSVATKEEGVEEIKYIERLKIGGRNVQETHYIFTLKEGRVAAKRVETFLPPPTTFDSYEMQTTES